MLCHFTVTDTGIGMSNDQVAKTVSNHSVRAMRRSTRNRLALVVGLAISQRLVDMLDGFPSRSIAPGQGSTFELPCPSKRRIRSTHSTIEISREDGRQRNRKATKTEVARLPRFLVVDDRSRDAQLASHFFGKSVRQSRSLEDDSGLRSWATAGETPTSPFDLILMTCKCPT